MQEGKDGGSSGGEGVCVRGRREHIAEEVYVTKAALNFCNPFFLSFFFFFPSLLCLPLRLFSLSHSLALPPLISPLPLYFAPYFLLQHLPPFPSTSCPLSPPCLSPCLSLSPSLLSLSAVQHSDYHSSHRVRPDSQILLSTLLHHLLLEGAMERERLRQRKERRQG